MDLNTIQKRIAQIDLLEQENRASREMLKSELESDPAYMQAAEEAKAAVAKKKLLKDGILGKGPNEKLLLEMKENQEEINTLKEILSAELIEVFKENDSEEVVDQSGGTRKFKVQVKLLPKKGSYQDRDSYGKYLAPEQGSASAGI